MYATGNGFVPCRSHILCRIFQLKADAGPQNEHQDSP